MNDLNAVILVGRLTRDAELEYTNSGAAVCRFSIANNRSKKQGDNWVDAPSFFDVDLWGKLAESLNQYLTKGKQIALGGELRQDRWEQDGQPRSKVAITATYIELLGGTRDEGRDDARPRQTEPRPAQPRRTTSSPSQPQLVKESAENEFTDGIPF